jgi:hypothetical protein
MFCLPKEFTSKFLNAIKDGTINPEKLIELSARSTRKKSTRCSKASCS